MVSILFLLESILNCIRTIQSVLKIVIHLFCVFAADLID